MSKKGLLFPVTLIAGAVAAVAGAVLFAKNENVRNAVKKGSNKALDGLKSGVKMAQEKVNSVEKKDDFVNFLSKTLGEVSTKLDTVNKDNVDSTFDSLAENINGVIAKFEEMKEENIDPAVEKAVDELKEAKKKIEKK